MAFVDQVLATGFYIGLAVLYLAVPIILSYYLIRRKFMSDRLRYTFAVVLIFDVLFIAFLVMLDIVA
jgi:hypothetical protein